MAGTEENDPSYDQEWERAVEEAENPPQPELAAQEPEDHPADPVEEAEEHPGVQAQPEPETPPNPVVEALQRLEQSNKEYSQSVTQSVGGLAEQLRMVNAEAAVARQTPGGPSQEAIDEAQKDVESWAKLKEDWPEWAGPIEQKLDHTIKAAIAAAGKVDEAKLEAMLWERVQKRLSDEKAAERAQAQADQQALQEWKERQKEGRAKVAEAGYADFNFDKPPKEFDEWWNKQGEATRALRNSMDPSDVINLLNMYTASRPPPRTAATQRAQAEARTRQGVVPSQTVTQGPSRGIDLSKMSYDELWDYKVNQDAAKAQRARA